MHNRALLRASLHGVGGPNLVPRALFPGFGVGSKPRKRALGTRLGAPQVEEGTHLSG